MGRGSGRERERERVCVCVCVSERERKKRKWGCGEKKIPAWNISKINKDKLSIKQQQNYKPK